MRATGNKNEKVLHGENKQTFKKVEKDIVSGKKARTNMTMLSECVWKEGILMEENGYHTGFDLTTYLKIAG